MAKRDRTTCNPYRMAAGLLVNRIRWDLTLAAFTSRGRLRGMGGKFAGERAVVLCNGPSLNKVPLEALSDVFTFGLNKINLMFDRTPFRPSCIVCVNDIVLRQNARFFSTTEIPLYLGHSGARCVPLRENVCFFHYAPAGPFAEDCSISIARCCTVTAVALQLAFHFGFQDVALVGCDHSFATEGPANKTVTSQGEDMSHFHRDYFGKGVEWQLPDLKGSEYFYAQARDRFSAAGRRVVNCTVGGKLEVFERMALNDWLKMG